MRAALLSLAAALTLAVAALAAGPLPGAPEPSVRSIARAEAAAPASGLRTALRMTQRLSLDVAPTRP